MSKVIAKRLRLARENKGLTQKQVFELTKINNKTLSGYENEVSEPDFETLKILATLYECSVDYLIGMSDDAETGKDFLSKPLEQMASLFGVQTQSDRKISPNEIKMELVEKFKSLPPDEQKALLAQLVSTLKVQK